jgi:hypothetical protein
VSTFTQEDQAAVIDSEDASITAVTDKLRRVTIVDHGGINDHGLTYCFTLTPKAMEEALAFIKKNRAM